jgi:hypothetical protein
MTKIALIAAVLFGSASFAVAKYDGDANQIPGASHSISAPASVAFDNVFASTRPVIEATVRGERDGDGNLVPGAR